MHRQQHVNRHPATAKLLSLQLLQSPASAAAEPNLACEGCPLVDIRSQVSDTRAAPLNAIGMLAREKQQPLSTCGCTLPCLYDTA